MSEKLAKIEKPTIDKFKKKAEKLATHRAALEAKHGLTGHPKAARLYVLAYSYGMGSVSDYRAVEMYYEDMADILKQ